MSRYADVLVKGEAKKTKRFVRSLKSEIRDKLIPLQLRNYLQAVIKALEVEMDIQESRKDCEGIIHLEASLILGTIGIGGTGIYQ